MEETWDATKFTGIDFRTSSRDELDGRLESFRGAMGAADIIEVIADRTVVDLGSDADRIATVTIWVSHVNLEYNSGWTNVGMWSRVSGGMALDLCRLAAPEGHTWERVEGSARSAQLENH